MKLKKFLSLALALVMMLALTAPAMAKNDKNNGKGKDKPPVVEDVLLPSVIPQAVDKIEGEDLRLPIVESGREINTAGYSAIYIKQANDVAIIVQAGDLRSDAEIIAEARASDKSLDKDGKGAITVIRGNGEVWLHKNNTTQVVVTNGILTVLGPISHIGFVGGPAPEFPDDEGETSTIFTMTKFVDGGIPLEEFTFEVYQGVEKLDNVAVYVEPDDLSTYNFVFEPALAEGTYEIREVLTADQAKKYEGGKTLTFTVDAAGEALAIDGNNVMLNISLGELVVNAPTVKQAYDEKWHTPEYARENGDTRVSRIATADLPGYITGNTYSSNGHTYLTINAAALAADPNGATIRIAKSDKDNTLFPNLAPAKPWEDPIPLTYNLKIANGKLVVTSTLPNFGFAVYGPNDIIQGNKDFKDLGLKHESEAENPDAYTYIKSWNMPKLAADGTFRFLIHYACPGYTSAVITGCNSENLIPRACERTIDPADVTITVTNAAGDKVEYGEGKKLPVGEYTVTVTVGTEVVDTQVVAVYAGQIATVTYDNVLWMEKGDDEYHCVNPSCPVQP